MNKTIQHMLQLSLDINAGAGKDVISLVPRLITWEESWADDAIMWESVNR